jgi:hypothetical protein
VVIPSAGADRPVFVEIEHLAATNGQNGLGKDQRGVVARSPPCTMHHRAASANLKGRMRRSPSLGMNGERASKAPGSGPDEGSPSVDPRMINHSSQTLRNQSEVLPDGSPRRELARRTVKKTRNSCLGLFRMRSIDQYFSTVGACTYGRVPLGH